MRAVILFILLICSWSSWAQYRPVPRCDFTITSEEQLSLVDSCMQRGIDFRLDLRCFLSAEILAKHTKEPERFYPLCKGLIVRDSIDNELLYNCSALTFLILNHEAQQRINIEYLSPKIEWLEVNIWWKEILNPKLIPTHFLNLRSFSFERGMNDLYDEVFQGLVEQRQEFDFVRVAWPEPKLDLTNLHIHTLTLNGLELDSLIKLNVENLILDYTSDLDRLDCPNLKNLVVLTPIIHNVDLQKYKKLQTASFSNGFDSSIKKPIERIIKCNKTLTKLQIITERKHANDVLKLRVIHAPEDFYLSTFIGESDKLFDFLDLPEVVFEHSRW